MISVAVPTAVVYVAESSVFLPYSSSRPIYDRLPSAGERYNVTKSNRSNVGYIKSTRPFSLQFSENELTGGEVVFSTGNSYQIETVNFGLPLTANGVYWAYLSEGPPNGPTNLSLEIVDGVWLNVSNLATFNQTQPTATLAKIIKTTTRLAIKDERVLVEDFVEPIADWLTNYFDELIIETKRKLDSFFSSAVDYHSIPTFNIWSTQFYGYLGKWRDELIGRWKDLLANAWSGNLDHPLFYNFDWAWADNCLEIMPEIEIYSDASLDWISYRQDGQSKRFVIDSTDFSRPLAYKYTWQPIGLEAPTGAYSPVLWTSNRTNGRFEVTRNGLTLAKSLPMAGGNKFLLAPELSWLGVHRSKGSLTTLAFLFDLFQLKSYSAELLPDLYSLTPDKPIRPWYLEDLLADEAIADFSPVGSNRGQTYHIRLPLSYAREGPEWSLAKFFAYHYIYFGLENPRNSQEEILADFSRADEAINLPPDESALFARADSLECDVTKVFEIVFNGMPSDPVVAYCYFVADKSAANEPVFDTDYPYSNNELHLRPLNWTVVGNSCKKSLCGQFETLEACLLSLD